MIFNQANYKLHEPKTKRKYVGYTVKNKPVFGFLLSEIQVLSLTPPRWFWKHQPSCAYQQIQMDEYTVSELCYEFGHTAYRHDHAGVCQATDLLSSSQGSPSMKHNDWNQVKWNQVSGQPKYCMVSGNKSWTIFNLKLRTAT